MVKDGVFLKPGEPITSIAQICLQYLQGEYAKAPVDEEEIFKFEHIYHTTALRKTSNKAKGVGSLV